MILADIHTHTAYSHAADGVRGMAESGRDAGLLYYGFSEHSPRPHGYIYPTDDYQQRITLGYESYIRDVQALQRENTANFTVLLGIEADFIAECSHSIYPWVSDTRLDYIIGGLHFLGHWGFDFSPDDWRRMDTARKYEAYTQYYTDMAEMCASGAHIISHPDLIKLFSIHEFNEWLDTPAGLGSVRRTLIQARDHDIIMEVSSAGLRKPCKEIYPGPKIMGLAAELGVKISISSDAHAIGHIAYAFAALEQYARSFGYAGSYIVIGQKQLFLPFNPA